MSAEKMREALETIKAVLRVDDPHGHYDLVCEALAQAEQRGEIDWEMRIAGPDDVLVFSDELEALQRTNEVNKQYLADRLTHPDSEVLCVATVHRVDAQGARPAPVVPVRHDDDEAVDQFAAMLKAKLAKSRAKGRSGWRDPTWRAADINAQMHSHIAKGDPVDVAAYAMFLALRGQSTAAPPAPVVPDGWRLVPERLTPQMGHAGDATLDDDGSMQEMWTNMLAASPEPRS